MVQPSVYNFGDVPESSGIVSTSFSIQNNSEDTVHVIHLKPSCGCTVVLMDTSVITPNSKVNFNVEYSTKNRPGSFFKTIKIYMKSGQKIWSTHIGLKGYVIPHVDGENHVKNIEEIKIRPFSVFFRHNFDTTGFVNSNFQQFVNALTYVVDKDQFVLIKPRVVYFHDYGEHEFVLKRLKKNLAYELKRRGYAEDLILYQIPEIIVRSREDYLNSGLIQLDIPGYGDTTAQGPYDVNVEVQKAPKDSIEVLGTFLNIQSDHLNDLKVKKQGKAMYNLSNAVVRNHMLGKLKHLQVNYYAQSNSKKLEEFIRDWSNEMKSYLSDELPEAIPIIVEPLNFVPQEKSGQPFVIEVLNIKKNNYKDTVTHVFKMAQDQKIQPSLPIMQFKTKNPGKGDLELLQKKRLFANFDAYKVDNDTLEMVCVLQHNGYLYDKDESMILEAIDHYQLVLESLHREAERQGFAVKSKLWVQPFHLTHWNQEDQNYISVQFLSQINGKQHQLDVNESFVGFYTDEENDSIVLAGVQSYYLDQMAEAINQKGWLAISLESYMYDDGLSTNKELRNTLITQTQKALDQIDQALLSRGVDPRRLIIEKEKIIVRNKPLDNVPDFGQHQPKGTLNKRFTKVVFNPSFDFNE